ncbi:hypothetical protein R3X43_28500, partial [Salmonella enterica subsp. enterica serovar Typhimurium]|nr:hypothetical protein [Salmonella enterica subsp. enterica serovar Typhimurium]
MEAQTAIRLLLREVKVLKEMASQQGDDDAPARCTIGLSPNNLVPHLLPGLSFQCWHPDPFPRKTGKCIVHGGANRDQVV